MFEHKGDIKLQLDTVSVTRHETEGGYFFTVDICDDGGSWDSVMLNYKQLQELSAIMKSLDVDSFMGLEE